MATHAMREGTIATPCPLEAAITAIDWRSKVLLFPLCESPCAAIHKAMGESGLGEDGV